MEVRLISVPSMAADTLCGKAAAKCYNGKNYDRSRDIALEGGHLSTAEHAQFTFEIDGVSRVLLAQLTRHRIASFSVQSQRYTGVKPEWIVPPSVNLYGYENAYRAYCDAGYALMQEMMEHGVPAEDARFAIPQGVTCGLIMSMNARELMHFFDLRCCSRAQWEIRALAFEMLELCKIAAPQLFENAGASCAHGPCPEGKKSCGKPWRSA